MNKRKEMITYLVFGVLTTIVNIVTYVLIAKLMNLDYKLATTIAWVVSVVFAFITNKIYVFNSKGMAAHTLVREFSSFVFFRVLTYLIDLGMMIILVEWTQMNDIIAKIVANIIVVIINYIASKYVIFRKAY